MSVEQLRKYGYPAAAILNGEGKNLFPDLFPDNLVPIRVETIISRTTQLEGLDGEHQVHVVNYQLIPEDVKEKFIKVLAEKFKVDPEEVREEAEVNGIPLRHSLVTAVGTDPRFFI